MKARIKATDSLWFDVEAEQEDELFKQIARVQEIFQHRGCLSIIHISEPTRRTPM